MFILGMFLEVVILKVWLFFNMVVVFDVVIFGYVVVNKELKDYKINVKLE